MTAASSNSNGYLVQFGKPGFVAQFGTAPGVVPTRGDSVVVDGPRGLELGTVLCEPTSRFRSSAVGEGVILRVATNIDHTTATRLHEIGTQVLTAAETAGLPIVFVDVEMMLDEIAILHAIPWADCQADALLEDLAHRFGVRVRLLDLSRMPTIRDESHSNSCGKPGCGSSSGGCSSCGANGGCSSGSCSSGSVRSANELTAYFASLRHQMEALSAARTPLT